MKLTVLLLALTLSLSAIAQSKPNEQPSGSKDDKKVDAQLHADVIRLFELTGLRQHLHDILTQSMPAAKKTMMDKCERCSPAFAEEWEKRMLARTNIADYLDVYVRVYEKYLTEEDVTEFITLQEAKKASKPMDISPRLKEK